MKTGLTDLKSDCTHAFICMHLLPLLQALKPLLEQRNADEMAVLLPTWAQIYQRLVLDNTRYQHEPSLNTEAPPCMHHTWNAWSIILT